MPDDVEKPATRASAGAGALEQLDVAVIAPRHTRRIRAALFQAGVLGASMVFVVLAFAAHTTAYFPIDLAVTRSVQALHGTAFDGLMHGVSWLGFFPQVAILGATIVLGLLLSGLRWEALAMLLATAGNAAGALLKLVVVRPRPGEDVVRVFRKLESPGFPSGHVLSAVACYGFLAFLCFTLLKPSFGRTATIAALALFIALTGLSRISLGQHWFSDVMGAYLFGSLWLALTVQVYRWGKPRFFLDQPLAPASPAASPAAAPQRPR
jgi:membrane-associated phospholipid phosphatase